MSSSRYIDICDKKYTGLCTVISLDVKYSPRLKVYALANGNTFDVKISKKMFNAFPINVGDTIKVESSSYEHRKRKDNESGNWVPIEGIKELWITSYRKM